MAHKLKTQQADNRTTGAQKKSRSTVTRQGKLQGAQPIAILFPRLQSSTKTNSALNVSSLSATSWQTLGRINAVKCAIGPILRDSPVQRRHSNASLESISLDQVHPKPSFDLTRPTNRKQIQMNNAYDKNEARSAVTGIQCEQQIASHAGPTVYS